jgi:lysozyme family protein
MSLFDKCISIILKSEGGYQCDPADKGNYTPDGVLRGTKYGISARVFPKIDIKNLTEDQAKAIYFKYYWTPMNLAGLTDELLALHVFDHGINCGKRTSIRMLQKLVDAKADGIVGPDTLKRANNTKMPIMVIGGYGMLMTLCEHFIYARCSYYTRLIKNRPALKKYIKGWYNRIDNTHF